MVDPPAIQPSFSQSDSSGRIQPFTSWTIQVTGTFTGLSLQIEGSLDNSTWVAVGPLITGAGVSVVPPKPDSTFPSFVYVRANILAISTGLVSVYAVGSS